MKKWIVLFLVFVFMSDVNAQICNWLCFWKPKILDTKKELYVCLHPQEGMEWCWAASLQMAFEHNLNLKISQSAVAASLQQYPNWYEPDCCSNPKCTDNTSTISNFNQILDIFKGIPNTPTMPLNQILKPKPLVVVFSNFADLTNQFTKNNAIILLNNNFGQRKLAGIDKWLPSGFHAVVGNGLSLINSIDSFIIINDPFAPCQGCKYWANIKCYINSKPFYFTQFSKDFLAIEDTSHTECKTLKEVNVVLNSKENKAIEVSRSILNDLIAAESKYNLSKYKRTNEDKSHDSYDLIYQNDFYVTIQRDTNPNSKFEIVEIGFCPYSLDKTIKIEVGRIQKMILLSYAKKDELKLTVHTINGYPNKFFRFFIDDKEYWSPIYNDYKLGLKTNEGYLRQFVENKFQ
jgi:hypothetical protein